MQFLSFALNIRNSSTKFSLIATFLFKVTTPEKTLKTFLGIFTPHYHHSKLLTTQVQHSFGLINSHKHVVSFSGVTTNNIWRGEGEMVIQLLMVSILVRLGTKIRIFVKWRLNRLCPSLKLVLPRPLNLMYTTVFLPGEGQQRALNFTPIHLGRKKGEGGRDSTEASYNSLYLTL